MLWTILKAYAVLAFIVAVLVSIPLRRKIDAPKPDDVGYRPYRCDAKGCEL